MTFSKEFFAFITQENVVNFATALIVASALSKIVSSFSSDILTPVILQPILNRKNIQSIDELQWKEIYYGKFISAIITFFIVSLVLFLILKVIHKD